MNASPGRSHAAEWSLVFVCLLWGTTFVLVKNALADVSTVLFLAVRFGAATLILLVSYLLRGGRLTSQGVLPGVAVGVCLFGGYLLQTFGLRYTSPAMSGFLTGLYIVMAPMLAAAVDRRVPRAAESIGIAVAGLGMGLMTLQGTRLALGRGEWLTLGCAFCFAFHLLLLGHYAKRMNTEYLSLLQIAACAAIATLALPWVEPISFRLSPALVLGLVLTSVFATALAFFIQTWAQARTTPTRAAVIFALEPVFAWMTSALVEGEVLSVRAAVGACCIVAGIVLVEVGPSRNASVPAQAISD